MRVGSTQIKIDTRNCTTEQNINALSARITAAYSNNKQVPKLIYVNVLKLSDTADVWRRIYVQESLRTSLSISGLRLQQSTRAAQRIRQSCDDGMKGGGYRAFVVFNDVAAACPCLPVTSTLCRTPA